MKPALRWLGLCLLAVLALQLFFLLRIASMLLLAPESTSFQRSQLLALAQAQGRLPPWRQQWVDYAHLSRNLKQAVIASEDDSFAWNEGVDWDALEKAWQKNAQAAQRAAQRKPAAGGSTRAPKVVGGSSITQQLAKNLFLSGERTLLRKGQELLLTLTLTHCLGKQRILEIYLNSVEWGEGVFGAQAAAQHYFHKDADQLSAYEAARLAVMLPSPRYFDKRPNSAYLDARAQVIVGRMANAQLP